MLRIRTLGAFELANGVHVLDAAQLRSRSSGKILAALLAAPGYRVQAGDLAERTWGADDPERLAKALGALRASLAELGDLGDGRTSAERVVHRDGAVSLHLPEGTEIDVRRFHRRAQAELAGSAPAEGAAQRLRAVLEDWTGEYLPFSDDAAIALARAEYAQLRRDLVWRLVEAEHDEARGRAVVAALARDYPEDQRTAEYLMGAALRARDRIGAVRAFEAYRDACAARGIEIDDDLRLLGEYLLRSTFGERSLTVTRAPVRGREADFAALDEALDALTGSRAAVLTVAAAEGVGVTTVLREATARARARGLAAAYARAYDAASADVLLHDLVRGLTRTLSVPVKISARLVAPDTVVHRGDTGGALTALRAAVAWFGSSRTAVLVAVDDAHRLAPETLAQIVDAVRGAAAALIVLGTHAPLRLELPGRRLHLLELDEATTLAIVADRIGAPPGPRFARLLSAFWPGNVRLAIAAARHAVQSGAARREGARWELGSDVAPLACVPERVYATISRAAEGLSADAYATASALAFVRLEAEGGEAALPALTGLDRARLGAALDELARRRLVVTRERMPLAVAVYFMQYCSSARLRAYRSALAPANR